MPSGSSSQLSARAQRTQRTKRSKGSTRVAPLYKRLPHGPHRLERDEVILNQRSRIFGAMIEAVGTVGYEETKVKQLIELAGVSRRSFYEMFANKEECFLAAYALLARRDVKQIRKAYAASDGNVEARLGAAFRRFAQMTVEDRKATLLVVVEGQRAGPAGVFGLRRALTGCEQLLTGCFAEAPGATPLPAPIVRGIVGGLHGSASAFLRGGHTTDELDIAEEMLRWTLLFQTDAAARMDASLTAALTLRLREISSVHGPGLTGAEPATRDERTRSLQAVLRLAAQEDYRELSGPQIADEANVSIDGFCELFSGKNECFLAALEMISDELLRIAADPELVGEDWPGAVRRVLAKLMGYLAEHPLHARTLTQEAFFAGPEALEHTIELSHSIATLLTEGAPEKVAKTSLTTEAIAGAIWHTIRCHATGGRPQLLTALSDHLAFVVFAPYIGADAAAEILAERAPVERRAPTDGACD
jgi:AcrR family transcriptional regulator